MSYVFLKNSKLMRQNFLKFRGIPRKYMDFRDMKFRIIPRNFYQFRTAYGMYGSEKKVRNSVLTADTKAAKNGRPLCLVICKYFIPSSDV
jgi:hypothetical protein